MLVRVLNGQDGIVEYLEEGVKSGRELSRDELDERVCIDGDLSITDKVINALNKSEKENNYYHITLSFGERDISEDDIIKAYDSYKEKLMNAYHDDEFNVYAEIHLPKVKSYKNKKTGETVERFPHVHMVIPTKNMVTNKALNPFGFYKSNVNYFDAMQEKVNREFNLESPYDNQRKYQLFNDGSDYISRYKGDNFKGSRGAFKAELFELINTRDIRSMSDFEKMLGEFGDVVQAKVGAKDSYLKVKLAGEAKHTRLKETCFTPAYIEERQLLRPKPTDKKINALVDEWVNVRSYEVKHVHVSSPKARKAYYALTSQKKQEFLNERQRNYNKQHDIDARGRTASRESGAQRVGFTGFTDIRNGLPSMPPRGLVRADGRGAGAAEGILSVNENYHMESGGASRNNKLRRINDRHRGIGHGRKRAGIARDISQGENEVIKPNSFASQLLKGHQDNKAYQRELSDFREIRQHLEPARVLSHFAQSHGLVPEHYSVVKVKGGSPRIKVAGRAYNVSDFCTQHMHQDWPTTKSILSLAYETQQAEKAEQRSINSIAFASDYATQGYHSKDKLSRLDESIRILNYLQRQEKQGENTMALADLEKYRVNTDILNKNTVEEGNISLTDTLANFKRQQKLAQELTLRMNDLVAAKNLKKNEVVFSDKNTGDKIFKDVGDCLVMDSRHPADEHVVAVMTLAAEKFGSVKVTGTKKFKQQAIDAAIAKDLSLVFADKKMQATYLQQKAEHQENLKLAAVADNGQVPIVNANTDNINEDENTVRAVEAHRAVNDKPAERAATSSVNQRSDISLTGELAKHANANTNIKANNTETRDTQGSELVSHGSAPYLHEKGNSNSYFVTLANGKTHWGVGLKSALEDAQASTGDKVDVHEVGRESVTIKVPIKDEQGKVLEFEEKDVERIKWTVDVLAQAQRGVDVVSQAGKPLDGHVELDNVASASVKPPEFNHKPNRKEQNVNAALADMGISKLTAGVAMEKATAVFEVDYAWDAKIEKMVVTINGQSPRDISQDVLSGIVSNDKFLKNYSMEAVQAGKLDMKQANGAQAVTARYDGQGKAVVEVQESMKRISKQNNGQGM